MSDQSYQFAILTKQNSMKKSHILFSFSDLIVFSKCSTAQTQKLFYHFQVYLLSSRSYFEFIWLTFLRCLSLKLVVSRILQLSNCKRKVLLKILLKPRLCISKYRTYGHFQLQRKTTDNYLPRYLVIHRYCSGAPNVKNIKLHNNNIL